jgi:hypothetical protein
VSISSNALLLLGAKTINDFNEDDDRTKLASNLYADVRNALLRSHPWNCAIKRVSLAPDVAVPVMDYKYQFSLPNDWLRTLQVGEDSFQVDYKSEGRKLLANDNPLLLRYIFLNDVESTWDVMLVQGMTLAMKAAMAYPITMSQAVADSAQKELFIYLRSCRTADASDDPAQTLGDFRLLNSRFSSGQVIIE